MGGAHLYADVLSFLLLFRILSINCRCLSLPQSVRRFVAVLRYLTVLCVNLMSGGLNYDVTLYIPRIVGVIIRTMKGHSTRED